MSRNTRRRRREGRPILERVSDGLLLFAIIVSFIVIALSLALGHHLFRANRSVEVRVCDSRPSGLRCSESYSAQGDPVAGQTATEDELLDGHGLDFGGR
jgi:hypothetical protein